MDGAKHQLMPLTALSLLLAACGGGSSRDAQSPFLTPPSSPIALSTKQDVLREIGAYILLHSRFIGDIQGLLENSSCTEGGTIDVASGQRSRDFLFYDLENAVVDYDIETHRGCQGSPDESEGRYYVTEGVYETGIHVVESESGPNYAYALIGNGDMPFEVDLRTLGRPSNEKVAFELLGAIEFKLFADDTLPEFTYRAESRVASLVGAPVPATTTVYGNDDEPMVATLPPSRPLTVTLDGPYGYATTDCVGGAGRIATLSPVTYLEGPDGSDPSLITMPKSGSIQFDNGVQTVTVIFDGEGGANYAFEGDEGMSDLSPDEILDSVADFGSC